MAVKRSLPFTLFTGEKWSIIAWAVLGCIITFSLWTYDVIGAQGRTRFTEIVIVRMNDALLPITRQWNENMERSSGFLQKLRIITPQTENNPAKEPTYPNSY